MERRYAYDLIFRGKIRLSPIRSYHDVEKLGTAIGDDLEGRTVYEIDNLIIDDYQNSPHRALLDPYFGNVQGRLKIERCSIEDNISNVYITSFTKLSKLNSTTGFEQADTCIKLIKLRQFKRIVCHQIHKKFKDVGCQGVLSGDCVYLPKKVKYLGTVRDSPLIKANEARYVSQAEYRVCWITNKLDLNHIFISNKKLKNCFKIINDKTRLSL